MNALAYYNRGLSKSYLKDEKGNIADCDIAIEINQNYSKAYYSRGLSKIYIGQIDNGCKDLSKAGELGYEQAYELIKKYCN